MSNFISPSIAAPPTPFMELILDVQGFMYGENQFIVKELASIPIRRWESGVESLRSCVFKPPCDWAELPTKKQIAYAWIMRHHHRLPWDGGEMSYNELLLELRETVQPATALYVWGQAKKQWLSKIIGHSKPIIDLADWGCPSPQVLRSDIHHCEIHAEHQIEPKRYPKYDNIAQYHCAVENVQRLKSWFFQRMDENQANYSTSEDEGSEEEGSKIECSKTIDDVKCTIKKKLCEPVSYSCIKKKLRLINK